MSQYSEMMGSFIRTGNYPMEANYIFPTKAALEEFYSDPINAATLHKGLLRIVESDEDNKQALYWVVMDDTLKFVRLIKDVDIDTIEDELSKLSKKLDDEIQARKDGDETIWGTSDTSEIPEDLNSILDLSKAITDLKTRFEETSALLKAQIKATVGTENDDVITYLQSLPYQSLTEVSNALNKFLNTFDSESGEINTLPELKSFLEGYTDTEKLKQVLTELYNNILGDPVPTEEFRTLRAIEDFIRILKSESEASDKNLQSEIDNTQIGVGLSGDGSYNADNETHYLSDATSVMNALKILDGLVFKALKGIIINTDNKDVVDLAIRKEDSEYVIGAKLNLSNVIGNDLIKKEDGLYFNVKSTYNNGTLSLYVNDKLISQHILGFSSIVESAKYNALDETIVIVFKLLDGEKQTVTIPVGALIRELEVDNSQPNKVVELTRETVVDGSDKLSADVRIYADKHNILKKVGNTLSVDGTSDSITHNDKTLKVVIEDIKASATESSNSLNTKLDSEISRAKAEEAAIKTSVTELKDNTNKSISDLKLKDTEIVASVQAETQRATEAEANIKASVQDLKDSDNLIKKSIEDVKVSVQTNSNEIVNTKNLISQESERAKNVEQALTKRVDSAETNIANITKQQTDSDKNILNLTNKLESEITRSTNKDNDLSNAITTEVSRAKEKETALENTLSTKIETVTIKKSETSDLQYVLYVDGKVAGEVNIPDDQFLQEARYDEVSKSLVFTFVTKEGTKVVSVGLSDLIDVYTAGDGLLLEDNKFSVRKCLGSQKYLEISADGLSIVGVDEALALKANVGDSYTKAESDAKYITSNQGASNFATKENLQKEVDRATSVENDLLQKINTKADINSPVLTGNPQVETSPDSEDSSLRIPSTSWVNAKIKEAVSKVDTTTYITREQVEELINLKADLVDGLVPLSQLPVNNWIDVE